MSKSSNQFLDYQEEMYYKEKGFIDAQTEWEYEQLKIELSKPITKIKKIRKYFPRFVKSTKSNKHIKE